MSDYLTPEKIYSRVLNSEIEKKDALKLFESLIYNNDNEEIRCKALEFIGRIAFEDEKTFDVIENCLISDESPLVRFEAAKTLIQSFPKRENKPLLWAIQNEKSIYFFKKLIDLLETYSTSQFKEIRKKTLEKINAHYNLNSDDSKFVLDIDYLDYLKFKTELDNFLSKFELSDADKQTLLKENTEIGNKGLGRVKKAEGGFIINLILTDINEIPASICNLRNLQELEISNCKIEKYPEKCPKLLSLKRIKFKNNTIDKVPSWIRYKS
ncbi:MAG: HEAT repeat domain-containing protein [Candidatus Lokiarchaeota archaeon]|nr:HEAT repeat domain-containing protein [Candidatus Lokiarchaeota archaeon]